jgi:arginyl-tRNA synthetase
MVTGVQTCALPDLAEVEYSSHYVATYLVDLAREWNAFYANTQVLDGSPDEPYKLALATLVSKTLANGLWLLSIPAPDRM